MIRTTEILSGPDMIRLRRPVLDTGLGFFVRRVKNSLAPHQVRGDEF
jgi:hypothetical protein